MNHFDVIVIGGGASGLMCAAVAGARGLRVKLLDKANKVGKKILMSGGGRCNFTNLYVEPDNFISRNPHFSKSALTRYTQWDFIALVDKYEISTHERKHGQLFCDDSAKEILAMLLTECDQVGVSISVKADINSITVNQDNEARFHLETSHGALSASSVVVASGGLSIPTMGASDYGYKVAEQFGHKIFPLQAGLVPFVFSDGFRDISNRLSGIAIDATISVGDVSFTEAVLFTHRGLSGPAVLQLSNYWQPGQDIHLDLLPGLSVPTLLLEAKSAQPRIMLRTLLARHLPKSLVAELEPLFWLAEAEKPLAEIPDARLSDIAGHLGGWKLKPSGTEGYRTAEVTLGGVDTADVSSKTMESKLQPGLYFIGEALDVTGHLGGFNFQWAWSSAFAAGSYV
ncbi:MAG: NAD(P)/FAD-dependent oxidoreductase [Pseudomonadales bacterium]